MVAFPNCKINIGLHVVNKREDGYHNIETIFYPVKLKDAIEIIEYKGYETISFTQTGIPVAGPVENNLCVRTYRLLKKDFPQIPSLKIHLHKAIPMGAGLGGGSSDAAFLLKLLNERFSLNLSISQLMDYALLLGSDCPFFILNKPCYASGRGEILEEIALDLSNYRIFIVYPALHIDTARAFAEMSMDKDNIHLKYLKAIPIEEWQAHIKNDFEINVFKTYPEIAAIKTALIQYGALYASMTGSGSTVFGIFRKENIPHLKFHPDYFCKWV